MPFVLIQRERVLLMNPSLMNFGNFDERVMNAVRRSIGFHALSGNPHHYSAGYRAMCEYNAGTLFLHPVFERFDYTLHLDTDSYVAADVTFDPFRILADRDLVYGYEQRNYMFDLRLQYIFQNEKC